jgi:hypothetical protein
VLAAPTALPRIYETVRIGAREPVAIEAQTFEAMPELTMRFALAGGARLLWTRHGAWRLEADGEPPHIVEAHECPRFV